MCPLTIEELDKWIKYEKGQKKEYPKSKEFLEWLRTNEKTGKNPYAFRTKAVKEKLDPMDAGRALYHIAQRRGYKSNRLETTKEKEHGKVKDSISDLQKEKNERTLGETFYERYKKGIRIRSQYTSRDQDYLEEFNKICEVQEFSNKLKNELEKATFFQRPLKSQKGLVGKCTFEPSKARCPISHPFFEEFRMLQFINSIKHKDITDKMIFLSKEDKEKIKPLFYRTSKPHFDFEEIRKKLTGKNEELVFNYKDWTLVSGCPTTARLKELLGEDWKNYKKKYIREKDGKESFIDYNDIWHVLFNFNDEEKIKEFGIKRLGFDEEKANKFSNINLKQGYASLSLCAIKKILPYLEKGFLYSHSAYFANLDKVLKDKSDSIKKSVKKDIAGIIDDYDDNKRLLSIANGFIDIIRNSPSFNISENQIKDAIEKIFYREYDNFTETKKTELFKKLDKYVKKELSKKEPKHIKIGRLDEAIKKYLKDTYDITDQALDKLYHPSDIDIYPDAVPNKDGKKYLGSPRTPSVRNPMAMKALHQLRYLINTLIKTGKISSDDVVNVELARELNDANMRAAIKWYQNDNEKKHKQYAEDIKKTIKENTGADYTPTETDILKYQLWEEQEHICLYTGKQINITGFISDNPLFDIEHTIPRSLSFDDSQENKTLCDIDYNRKNKIKKIPYELPKNDYDLIQQRLEPWLEKIKSLNDLIYKAKKSSRAASVKEEKDKAIQRKHYLTLQRDYWKNKYDRFMMDKVPEGFTKRQFVDTTIITKYARAYLNTVFDKVFTIKGTMTAEFRKLWGLQDEFTKKERISHTHHTIDAIVIACIGKGYNNLLSEYYKKTENEREYKPKVKKPWETFAEDVKKLEDEIIAKHYTKDSTLKQSKKIVRVRGRIKRFEDEKGNKNIRFVQGDSFRGSLHKETFYGKIKLNNKHENPVCVTRKPLDFFIDNEKKLMDIVDNCVKEKILNAIKERKEKGFSLKEALDIKNNPIWMNGEKKIPINKVRIYTPDIKNPIELKKHRDLSKHDYKQNMLVDNDENNVFGIYEGIVNGKNKRIFIPINNFEVSKGNVLPNEKDGLKLIYTLKKGTMVLIYENTPEEIKNIENKYNELSKRLYKLFKFDANGQIYFIHHLEARPKGELKSSTKFGAYKTIDDLWSVRMFYPNQLNVLVENVDFIITNDSRIKFIKK